MRLGVPFVVHLIIFGIITKIINPSSFPFPIAGVTWFLAWLIILNLAYVFRVRGVNFPKVGTEPPQEPPFVKLYDIGAIAGLLNGAIMVLNDADHIFNGGKSFIMMPTTYGSLPFYILFFEGGILARRQGWLTHALPAITRTQRFVALFLSVFLISAAFLQISLVYPLGGGGWSYIPTVQGEDPSLGKPTVPLINESAGRQPLADQATLCTILVVATSTIMGIFCISFNILLLDQLNIYGNFETKFTSFLSKTSYIAFLIQAPFVIGFTKVYTILLGMVGYDTFTHEGGSMSSTKVPEGLFVLGWLFVASLSLIVCFCLGAIIRKIPVCKKIL